MEVANVEETASIPKKAVKTRHFLSLNTFLAKPN